MPSFFFETHRHDIIAYNWISRNAYHLRDAEPPTQKLPNPHDLWMSSNGHANEVFKCLCISYLACTIEHLNYIIMRDMLHVHHYNAFEVCML